MDYSYVQGMSWIGRFLEDEEENVRLKQLKRVQTTNVSELVGVFPKQGFKELPPPKVSCL